MKKYPILNTFVNNIELPTLNSKIIDNINANNKIIICNLNINAANLCFENTALKLFNDKAELQTSMFNYLKLQQEKPTTKNNEKTNLEFQNEKLNIQLKEYYFSNVIARSSKTMIECNTSKLNIKSTGTEG